ncbi:archease [Dethiosulfatarculus sandiegensis]|uniref:Archease domain-containing protein n=1 Tax=Dethiosulfatarculus sandiegensis TaxID=1429043 RepID=A0A0D2GIK2_9BACT|nr:archease [Dethiosulfatarculus sandiegensis]KIX14642.1 hypothetical protein X474_08090 [Dethiosulfatarculus sandiegensis]
MDQTWGVKPHTADICLWAKGKSIEELFINSATALMEYCCTPSENNLITTREFRLKAPDNISLLIYFLNDILYLLEVDYLIFNEVENLEIQNNKLRATLIFSLQSPELLRIKHPVKAVTLHEAVIKKSGVWFKAYFILDL